MNERIKQLADQVDKEFTNPGARDKAIERFAELIVKECIGILETEIELVKEYKSIACNEFDERWHEGKILHFTQLMKKTKKHFGVES
jgi:hypothetical protein